MISILLFQTPPYLGFWGQILLFAVGVLFAGLTWKHSLALKEFNILKDSNERLRVENKSLIAENAALKERTDLTAIVERIARWENESRSHFEQAIARLEEIHSENNELGKELVTSLKSLTLTILREQAFERRNQPNVQQTKIQ